MAQNCNITLRLARADEAEILTDLSLRSKRSNGYDDAFMAACRKELTVTPQRMSEGEYWVADCDGVRGIACLAADMRSRTGEIHAFFIDPDWQRKGIGDLLWQKLRERAAAQKLTLLHLDADPDAVAFYEAMGFSVTGSSPSGSIPGRNLPYMTLAL